MALAALANWENTRIGLHEAAQVLGAIRKQVAEPQPNYLHLSLRVSLEGVTTGPLPFGGELLLDFPRRAVRYARDGVQVGQVLLSGHTQLSLTEAVLDLLTMAGHDLVLDWAKLTGQTPFAIHPRTAADYAVVLSSIHTVLGNFRGRLTLPVSPLVVWPHNFDLSFLAFANAEQSEDKLHAAFGFEPRSPGLERPYFYAYVRPTPDDLTRQPLPALAHWHTEGWTGAIIHYDDLISRDDPEGLIETLFDNVYTTLAPYLEGQSETM